MARLLMCVCVKIMGFTLARQKVTVLKYWSTHPSFVGELVVPTWRHPEGTYEQPLPNLIYFFKDNSPRTF